MIGWSNCRCVTRLLLAALLSCASLAASAQSDEPWVSRAPLPAGTVPLLALVIDTSAAMAETVATRAPYDPDQQYAAQAAAPCDPARVYWRRGPGPAPDCQGGASLPLDAADVNMGFRCRAGRNALARTGIYIAARAAQWSAASSGGYWRELLPGDEGAVECRADRGAHGSSDGPWYAAHGGSDPWSRDADREPLWDAAPLSDSYVFLSGNYLNYLASPATATMSRYAATASLAAAAAASADGLQVAVLRPSHDGLPGDDAGRGGMVALAPALLPAGAQSIAGVLDGWSPAGPAPLAETVVEVAAWLTGGPVLFGDNSQAAPGLPWPSAAGVRDPQRQDRYITPFTAACRPVSVGLVTAGRPSSDDGAGAAAASLSGFPPAGRACGNDCLAALADWLRRFDLVTDLAGDQRAALFIAAPAPLSPALAEVAVAAAAPVLDLDDPLALTMMIAHALQHDAAVASGARLSAAGLASTTGGLRDPAIYFGLSIPAAAPRWAGNLRKYRWRAAASPLAAPTIVDGNDRPAFDESGTALLATSQSVWASRADGADALLGGAAAALPPRVSRRVYTDIVSNTLTESGNRIAASNAALTRESLGLLPQDRRSTEDLIDWLLGADAFDADRDGRQDESRPAIGDPGLSAPVTIDYGGAGAMSLVFAATNDGLLHAFNETDGTERWAFLPRTMLKRLADLAAGFTTVSRSHGLDGTVTRHVFDADGDGRLAPGSGDRAWLVVGLGRGGPGYYALDVTDPDRPRVLWSLVGAAAAALGEARPAAVIARMQLDDRRQGPHRLVVVLAGGHDPAQSAWPRARDQRGARLLILDAESGEVLWQAAGPDDETAELALAGLSASLPSAPRALDMDGDGYADTLYLLGIDGHLWRIRFPSRAGAAGATRTLLGRFGEPAARDGRQRRFYASPDVSYDANAGQPRLVVSFGSGWLARPRDVAVEDRFYAVYDALGESAQADASHPRSVLGDSDLHDVTDWQHAAPAGARGWLLRLVSHGHGEKTTGASLTFDHRLRFTTYQPLAASPGQPCGPPAGRSRLYTLDVRSGRPVNWIGDQPVPSEDLAETGLPPDLRVVFPPRDAGRACGGGGCSSAAFGLIGGHSLDLQFRNDPVRTSWRRLAPTPE